MKRIILLLSCSIFGLLGFAQNYIDYIEKINYLNKKDIQQDICISPDKKFLAIASLSNIAIVDIANFKLIKSLPIDYEEIHLISFTGSGDKILVVANNQSETVAEVRNIADNKIIISKNPIMNGKVSRSWTSGAFAVSKNYLVAVTNEKKIFISNINTLEHVKNFDATSAKGKIIYNLAISPDESYVAFDIGKLFGGKTVFAYDINGKLQYSKTFGEYLKSLAFLDNNELCVSELKDYGELGNSKYEMRVYQINLTKSSTKEFTGPNQISHFTFSTKRFTAFLIQTEGRKHFNKLPAMLSLYFKDDDSRLDIMSYNLYYNDISFKSYLQKRSLIEIKPDIYMITVGYENFNYLVDTKNRVFLGYFYYNTDGVSFIAADGRFTGDHKTIDNLSYNIYSKPSIPLTSQVNQFYTPKLFSQVISPTLANESALADLSKVVKLSPEIRITSPDSITLAKSNKINLRYTLKDNGDGIKEIKFFINGKLMNYDIRGFKVVEANYQEIPIITGENIIEAVAISNSGYQSSPDRVEVSFKGAELTTNLYILGIGIDAYKNSRYNLNYAVADVSAVVDYISANATGIFKKIDKRVITDQNATKANIVAELNRLSQEANESDVFLLYYAGHGVMNQGSADVPKDYYMVLSDVHQMFGNDALLSEKGISAAELRDFCKRINAQKQVILLDACQSGGATETFALRGASEEKAIIQLAQSTGVFLISSTGAEQFASEFAELSHGVFTYALLDGLRGAADGGSKDGKITIKEVESFLNDKIPELTQKYRGSMQFPNTWSRGMDFPIVVVK